jgi:hypothetical protein
VFLILYLPQVLMTLSVLIGSEGITSKDNLAPFGESAWHTVVT